LLDAESAEGVATPCFAVAGEASGTENVVGEVALEAVFGEVTAGVEGVAAARGNRLDAGLSDACARRSGETRSPASCCTAAAAVGINARNSPISRSQAVCNAFRFGGRQPREPATEGELGAGRMVEVDIFFHHEGVFTGVAQRRVIAPPHADL